MFFHWAGSSTCPSLQVRAWVGSLKVRPRAGLAWAPPMSSSRVKFLFSSSFATASQTYTVQWTVFSLIHDTLTWFWSNKCLGHEICLTLSGTIKRKALCLGPEGIHVTSNGIKIYIAMSMVYIIHYVMDSNNTTSIIAGWSLYSLRGPSSLLELYTESCFPLTRGHDT